MKNNRVLILGTGHLAYRVKRLAEKRGFEVGQVNIPAHFQKQGAIFDDIQALFSGINLKEMAMVYILDDRDDYNLGLAIALISVDEHVPITVSLFNENITPHLKATHPNIHVLNPAKIAAPQFVESLSAPEIGFLRYQFTPVKEVLLLKTSDPFLRVAAGFFGTIIIGVLAYFTIIEKVPFVDTLYYIVATIAGGTDLFKEGAVSKLVETFLIMSSLLFMWIIFTLTADRIIKLRSEYSLGRKKYSYKNHVIVVGLGRLGHFIVEELVKRGEQVVVVELNEHASSIEYYRSKGVAVYVGNARLVRVLQEVGVVRAKALMGMISDDYINLEIGLNARSCNAGIKLVLRIFDDAMAATIRDHLDIHLAYSMSALSDEAFLETVSKK